MFGLLVKVRLRSLLNVGRYAATNNTLLSAGLTIAGVLLFVVVYLGFKLFLGLSIGPMATEELVAEVFYFLFLFLLAGAVPFVASTLLQSTDYVLLLASPVKPRAVIAAKLLDATITNSLQFTVIGLPAIASCAVTMGVQGPWWAYVLLLTGLFVLVPALATALTLLAALSIFGIRRVRQAIAVVNLAMAAIVCLTIVIQVNRLPIRHGFGLAQGASFQTDDVTSMLLASPHSAKASPPGWFAHALIQAGRHETLQAVKSILGIGAVVAALFALCTLLGERLLSAGALDIDEDGGTPVAAASRESERPGLRSLLGFPIVAVIAKDLRFIARDTVLLGQLGMPVILFFVPFALAMQQSLRGMASAAELYFVSIGMTGFILFMQTSILSLSSIGIESRSFWMLLTSPNQARVVLWGKFLASVAVSAGVGCGLTIFNGLVFRADLAGVAFQCTLVICVAMALCGLGVGISAALPRFVYENPAHRVSAWALILGFFTTAGYIFLSSVILMATMLIASQITERAIIVYLFGATVFAALTLSCTLLPMALGARRLNAYQWTH